MARDATARLYDVDEDSLIFEKMRLSKKYDQGKVIFRAKKGKLVYLDKLHESIWATRLSGGTSSGVVSLEVTTVGDVIRKGKEVVLRVHGSDREFVLVSDVKAKPADVQPGAYQKLIEQLGNGKTSLRVTGYVDGWLGRWPGLLRRPPTNRPRLMVTNFEPFGDAS